MAISESTRSDSDIVALGYESGLLNVFDLDKGKFLFRVSSHHREITAVCITETLSVVTGANDFNVRCTGKSGSELWTYQSKAQPTALLTSGDLVVAGYRNGECHCLDIHDGSQKWILDGDEGNDSNGNALEGEEVRVNERGAKRRCCMNNYSSSLYWRSTHIAADTSVRNVATPNTNTVPNVTVAFSSLSLSRRCRFLVAVAFSSLSLSRRRLRQPRLARTFLLPWLGTLAGPSVRTSRFPTCITIPLV